MNKKQRKFKKEHERFNFYRMQSIWNGEQIKKVFPKGKLIVHLLLCEELFYAWGYDADGRVNRALSYAQDAYTDTTLNDLRKVYKRFKNLVWSIYG